LSIEETMKRIILLSVGLLHLVAGFSQNGTHSQKTLLWKVSGKGITRPSYLFGTMHILCADDAKLSDSLTAAISKCDEIYFEIKLDDFSGMMKSIQFMRMNDNKKLSDLLSPSDYAKVKSYFEAHGPAILPFSLLERFKPLLISSLIEEEGMDCNATNGMELVIMKAAKEKSKPINGLETAEFQAGLFDSIPYEKQAKDLVNYIDSVGEYKKMTTELAMVYKQQDLDKIDSLTRYGDATIGSYLDLLLYGRNRRWVEAIKPLMQEKSLLIAVGAGHLPGENGLINLLLRNGYTLTPVNNK